MKRFLHLICLLAVAALLPAAFMISRGLPADARPYVEQKYAGWNGVLRAWICADWECAGSFTRWLNACAAEFEKSHEGVYIEFTPVSADVLRQMRESGIRPPELVLFSPGMLEDVSAFMELDADDALRSELRGISRRAFPVAMGGYVWVYNRGLCDGAPAAGSAFALLPDDAARSFSAAAVALLSDAPDEAPSENALPDAGLDLGLPANASIGEGTILPEIAEDAINRFINGELPAVVVSQAELARLIRLRDGGRGPDWACAAAGSAAYTDQLLMLGVVLQTGDAAEERMALAERFAVGLLEYGAQAKLADIGAFSVTGDRIYPDLSAYAQLDALLSGRNLIVPRNLLRPLPDCAALLHARACGNLDAVTSLAQLRSAMG